MITFLTTLQGSADGSVFGYGFFPGIVALLTWSIATSIASYRAVRPAAESTGLTTIRPNSNLDPAQLTG